MPPTEQTKIPVRPAQTTEQTTQTAAEKKIAKKMKSKKLAEKRTATVLEKIRLLGNLASSNYALTTEEKKQIVDAIANAGAELEARFEQACTAERQTWHFE